MFKHEIRGRINKHYIDSVEIERRRFNVMVLNEFDSFPIWRTRYLPGLKGNDTLDLFSYYSLPTLK